MCKNVLEPEFEVVGIVNNGRALVRVAASLKPDVIVLEIAMPLLDGLDASQQVRKNHPAVKLIFLTVLSNRRCAGRPIAPS